MKEIIKRTLKDAWKNFLRNGWLSFATSLILMFSLYTVSLLFLIILSANVIIKNIQDKSNISIYFKQDVAEEIILGIQTEIEKNGLIKSVTYVSKEQALEDFKNNNANEELILKSIKEIGENPLLSSLVIKAHNPAVYQAVYDYLSAADFKDNVSRINYTKNKDIIDKLNSLVNKISGVGLSLASILTIVSILITFNAIRITIYSRREEMEIMRLVGASNSFIRLPYIFEGILYGLCAAVISLILLALSAKAASSVISSAVLGQSLISFFGKNFLLIFGLQIFIGVALGIASSMIAIRRYLKI
jgi:cell division transport system permease protein